MYEHVRSVGDPKLKLTIHAMTSIQSDLLYGKFYMYTIVYLSNFSFEAFAMYVKVARY